MTNYEYYKEEIEKIKNETRHKIAIIDNKPKNCFNSAIFLCNICKRFVKNQENTCNSFCSDIELIEWCLSECEEKIELSEKEKIFLSLMKNIYNSIEELKTHL